MDFTSILRSDGIFKCLFSESSQQLTKQFYYDYFSLKNADIKEWYNHFFWPVSRKKIHKLVFDMQREQGRIINQLGNTFEGDCLLIGYHILYKYANALNQYLSVKRLLEKEYQIVYSDRLKLIPLLLKPQNKIVFEHENLWSLQTRNKVSGYFKRFIKSILYNQKKKRYNLINHFFRSQFIVAFSNDYIINRPYADKIKKWIRITSPEEWLDSDISSSISSKTRKIFADISESYVSFAKQYMQNFFGMNLPINICEALFNYTICYLEHISQIYTALQKKVKDVRPKHLLVPTGGKTFIRALSLAVRNQKGKVTGFPHAYFICHSASPRPYMHEFATVNEFVSYTPGSVALMKRNVENYPPPRKNPVKFVHENSSFFLETWNKFKNIPIPKKNKTVMVLELALFLEDTRFDLPDSMVNYHFYYKICKTLSDNGYNVIFKRRPKDYNWEGINLFENIPNITILYEPFERPDIISLADAIMVQYGLSSTLFWSMCTNKTVVYINARWEPWFPKVYELMAKRCRILNCWYDKRNRQCFDEDELLNILETPPETPNTEFLEKYLFPE